MWLPILLTCKVSIRKKVRHQTVYMIQGLIVQFFYFVKRELNVILWLTDNIYIYSENAFYLILFIALVTVNTLWLVNLLRWNTTIERPTIEYSVLTHRGQLTHICVSEIEHHWSRYWLGAKQVLYIVNWIPANKCHRHLSQNTIISIK